MFVRVKTSPNSPRRSVQIVESRRVGKKVKQVIVRHIGIALDEKEEAELRRLAAATVERMALAGARNLPLFSAEDLVRREPSEHRKVEDVRLANIVEEERIIEGIHEVMGRLFDELGFERIVGRRQNSVLKSVVLARIAQPSSKLRTAALLESDFGVKLPLDRIYRTMDSLFEKRFVVQDVVREATLSLLPGKIDVVLFDVTTLYFESVAEDELRKFGYSKDQKFQSVQVVLALATTTEGLPVGYRVFPGNTAETKTLVAALESWRTEVEIGRVTVVADRAMMSESNLKALDDAGIEYIIGASLKKMKAEVRQEVLDGKAYRLGHIDDDIIWSKTIALGGKRRLVASYSKKRARKDLADRNRLVERAQKRLGASGNVKKIVSNKGLLSVVSFEGQQRVVIDEDKISNAAEWDGMYGVVTNADGDPLEVLARYRRLWVIEESFRVHKHDLAIRPIFHFSPQRIEAHIAICYLAFALLRHAHHRIRIRQGQLSLETIRNELLRVQASIVRDKKGGGRYRIPARMTPAQKAIYRAFDLKRSDTPSAIK